MSGSAVAGLQPNRLGGPQRPASWRLYGDLSATCQETPRRIAGAASKPPKPASSKPPAKASIKNRRHQIHRRNLSGGHFPTLLCVLDYRVQDLLFWILTRCSFAAFATASVGFILRRSPIFCLFRCARRMWRTAPP
jgi:hypothetical protein